MYGILYSITLFTKNTHDIDRQIYFHLNFSTVEIKERWKAQKSYYWFIYLEWSQEEQHISIITLQG